jgi:hypothetical protein
MNLAGATVSIQSHKACVVYDSSTGQIHHEHRVLTLVGGREPTDDEIAKEALRVAATGRREAPRGNLDVLHIIPQAWESGKTYRVDVHNKKLVSET